MVAPHHRTLLMLDGSLASLVAGACLERPDRAIAWIPLGLTTEELAAARRQTTLLGCEQTLRQGGNDDGGASARPPLSVPATLLAAASDALTAGCRTVVWPVQAGTDIEEIALAADRARLVSLLALLEDDSRSLRIELPMLDLTHEQLRDLAADLTLPLDDAQAQPLWVARDAGQTPHTLAGA